MTAARRSSNLPGSVQCLSGRGCTGGARSASDDCSSVESCEDCAYREGNAGIQCRLRQS